MNTARCMLALLVLQLVAAVGGELLEALAEIHDVADNGVFGPLLRAEQSRRHEDRTRASIFRTGIARARITPTWHWLVFPEVRAAQTTADAIRSISAPPSTRRACG